MAIPLILPVVALLGAHLTIPPQAPRGPFQALEERGTAETFLVMMQLTGLRGTLEASGEPYTLLAPVDTAFSGVEPEVVARLLGEERRDALRDLLRDHVLTGRFEATDFIAVDSVTARSGATLPVGITGGRLTLRGVPIAPQGAGASVSVEGGAVIELGGVILRQPSLLELTPARRLAARGLRLASQRTAEGEASLAAKCAVLEMSLAASIECANESELALLGVLPTDDGSPASNERLRALQTPLLRVLGRPVPGANLSDPAANAQTSMTAPQDDARLLLALNGSEDEPGWFTLNDDVMGGISTSSVGLTGSGLLFQGTLSLENNGGFASIRSNAEEYDLSGTTGLRLRVRSDGREYGVSVLAGDERGRTGSWRKRFQVPAGEWTTVDVPFQDMVLNVRGRQFPEVGPPELAKVRSFSFIIADKDVSPFRLEVGSISAYRE